MQRSAFSFAVLVLALGVTVALVDLVRLQQATLVIYTTPALRDLLEQFVVPTFHRATGVQVSLIYVSAGEQYNRVRMSGGSPEADVFLHASPLFIEKGFAEGHFVAFDLSRNASIPTAFKSREVPGGHLWYAFGWSPLVEVYKPALGAAPDLASINIPFGFPHPQLSNNGIYAVLFFQSRSPSAGAQALAHTVVQPANARANILGIADGSFDVTLGYEAVTLFYLKQGAKVASDLPLLSGQHIVEPVILSAGLVYGHQNPRSQEFIEFLFSDDVQGNMSRFSFRSAVPGFSDPSGGISLPAPGAANVTYDWSQWPSLEANLTKYIVGG